MAVNNIQDPLIGAWFSIEFQGTISGAFQECSGLSSENEVVEYKASGSNGEFVVKKLPGRPQWGNITLKRGVTSDLQMWQWRQIIEKGDVDAARKNGTLTMYSTKGQPVAKWNFTNAWPTKVTGPSADATTNAVAVEELELAHEGIERVS